MVLVRHLLGGVLRRQRLRQGLTLREVSIDARVSRGYISEVERGQKEASSELLAAICSALEVPLSDVLREVSDEIDKLEGVITSPVRKPGLTPVQSHRIERSTADSRHIGTRRIDKSRIEAMRIGKASLETTRLDASRLEATRLEPTVVESVRVEPVRVESVRVESSQIDSADAEPEGARREVVVAA
jgi:transcriptional regulator with XRE-family HTH domain